MCRNSVYIRVTSPLFFFQAEDGIRDYKVTGVQTCALPICGGSGWVVLGFNLHTRQLENYWMADHAHGPAATVPILVMDRSEERRVGKEGRSRWSPYH